MPQIACYNHIVDRFKPEGFNIYKRGEHVYKTLNYYGITETRSALFLHGWPTLSIVAY